MLNCFLIKEKIRSNYHTKNKGVSNLSELIIEILAFYLGAAVITLFIYKATNRLLKNKVPSYSVRTNISLTITVLVLLLITSNTMTLIEGIVFYVPTALLWYVMDRYKNRKQTDNSQKECTKEVTLTNIKETYVMDKKSIIPIIFMCTGFTLAKTFYGDIGILGAAIIGGISGIIGTAINQLIGKIKNKKTN